MYMQPETVVFVTVTSMHVYCGYQQHVCCGSDTLCKCLPDLRNLGSEMRGQKLLSQIFNVANYICIKVQMSGQA